MRNSDTKMNQAETFNVRGSLAFRVLLKSTPPEELSGVVADSLGLDFKCKDFM